MHSKRIRKRNNIKTLIMAVTALFLGTAQAIAGGLSVKQNKDIITVQNNHYTAKINVSRNYQIFSLQNADKNELLSKWGIEAAGDYPGARGYWMAHSKAVGKAEITSSPQEYVIINQFVLLGHTIGQTLRFQANREVIEVSYEILSTAKNYKAGIINLPVIDVPERFNTVWYPTGTKLKSLVHGMKSPKDNFEINTPGNWFATSDANNDGIIVAWRKFPPKNGKWWPPVYMIRWVYGKKPMLRFIAAGDAASKKGIKNTVYIAPRKKLKELSIHAREILEQLDLQEVKDKDLVHWPKSKHVHKLAQTGNLKTFWAPGAEKIKKNDNLNKLAVKAENITVSLAKNEAEGFQVLLDSTQQLNQISATLEADNNLNLPSEWIKIYRMAYPEVKAPDDNKISYTEYPSYWPDALLRLNEQKLLPGLMKDHQGALYVSIRVPKSARAGIYNGKIKIKCNSNTLTIPFKVNVWNFSLPQIPSITTFMGVSKAKAKIFRKHLSMEEASKDYISKLEQERMSAFVGELALYSTMDLHKYADSLNINCLPIHLYQGQWGKFRKINGLKFNTPEYWEWLKKYLSEKRKWFKENKIKKTPVTLPYDEPAGNEFGVLEKNYKTIRSVWPELAIILTEKYMPRFKNLVDIWCTPSYEVTFNDVKKIHADGKEAWYYTCCSERYPYPTMRIDRPGAVHRAIGWLAWRYDLDGYLFWNSNEWSPTAQDRTLRYRIAGPQGGDGYLFYPNLPGRKLNPSLRLFQLRDGLEDAEYMLLIDKLAAQNNPQAKSIQKKAEKIFKDFKNFPYDSTPIYFLRKEAGTLLSSPKGD